MNLPRRSRYAVLVVLLLACGFVVVLYPHRFQKYNSIELYEGNLADIRMDLRKPLDIQAFLGAVPYRKTQNYYYATLPREKYERSLLGGDGDCSNFSFGAAYYLLGRGIDFDIVHFLPADALFSGDGHVALRVPYLYRGRSGAGVLDPAGGGVPLAGGRVLDYPELPASAAMATFVQINNRALPEYAGYYSADYLRTVSIGITPAAAVERYFRFIETIYLPFHKPRLEKMLYDGMALLSGSYYPIYVDKAFFDRIRLEKYMFTGLLAAIRLFLALLLFCVVFDVFATLGRRLFRWTGVVRI